MKKTKRVFLAFLIMITTTFSVIVFWQYENISAVLYGLRSSPENIASEIDKKRDELKEKIEKYTIPVNDLTAEDERKLLKGEVNLKDIADKYNLPIEYMTEDNALSDAGTDSKPTGDDTAAAEKRISESISRLYALKAKYVNKLGELEREIIEEYSNLPKPKQNKESKKEFVMANMDYVSNLEKTCDSEVDKVIESLEKDLKESGGDLEIIQILKDAYNDEKFLKKSYYLSLYN